MGCFFCVHICRNGAPNVNESFFAHGDMPHKRKKSKFAGCKVKSGKAMTRTIITKATAAILLAVTLTGIISCNASRNTTKQDQAPAKYVFLFIGDGMGAAQAATAESYLSYLNGKLGGEKLCFTGFPVLGSCTTYSADHHITCSSASGTAISCGTKTNNGYLGVDPAGNRLRSIAYDLKDEGYKIGIMSSVPVNHATPASFYAHNLDRGDYYNISLEIPESGFDFFGGSGFLQYSGKDKTSEPTPEVLEEKGYTVCFGEKEFREEMDSTEHIVFIQPSGKEGNPENYEVNGPEEEDSRLAEMLQTCVDYFGDKEPFFIMCEGGEIDWAAHDNMAMPMVDAILRFNEAVATAYSFYEKHPDETLIIVTADHETGGVTLGSNGTSTINWKEISEAYKKDGEPASATENKRLNDAAGIGWTTNNHTGAPVPVYAVGKGSERFSGRLDNTEIKGRILNRK